MNVHICDAMDLIKESLGAVQDSGLYWKGLETWFWNEEVEDSQEAVEYGTDSGFAEGKSVKSSNT